jgi:hypothetical protein
MQKCLTLHGQKVEYTLTVGPRATRLRLAIHRDGRFVVTIPRRMNPASVEPFILRKASWILKKLAFFKNLNEQMPTRSTKKDFDEHKEAALALAKERIEYWNQAYGFIWKKVSIKNQKTRWGSCSRKGNLNFNFKIILLPPHLADYLVVHELCHLKEMNHSKRFWALVAKTIPDYLARRRELRKNRISFF